MKKIVIIGSSVAGAKAAEVIRGEDSSCEITIITSDGYNPYNREAFLSFISRESERDSLYYKPEDFYTQKNISLVADKKIHRINFNRKKVTFEDKSQIDFNILIIGDSTANRFNEIKGNHRTGIYGLRKMKDVETIVKEMPFFDIAAVESDTFSGLRVVSALSKAKKEVVLVMSKKSQFTAVLEQNVFDKLSSILLEKHISIVNNTEITEVLGEKEAKAIKLHTGKVYASQLVLFCEADDDLRIYSDQGIEINKKINVNEKCETSVKDVYAVDNVSENKDLNLSEQDIMPLEVLEDQGNVVAQRMLGKEASCKYFQSEQTINFEGIDIEFLGEVKRGEDILEISEFSEEPFKYRKLFIRNGRLIGVLLLNSSEFAGKYSKILKSDIEIHKIEQYLLNNSYSFEDIENVLNNPDQNNEGADGHCALDTQEGCPEEAQTTINTNIY